MITQALRFVHRSFARSGRQTAMKRSTQMKTTIHEHIIFDVRYAQKNARQPATSTERTSTPIRLWTQLLLRVDTTIRTMSDSDSAMRKTLKHSGRKFFASITRIVKTFPQKPATTRTGNIMLDTWFACVLDVEFPMADVVEMFVVGSLTSIGNCIRLFQAILVNTESSFGTTVLDRAVAVALSLLSAEAVTPSVFDWSHRACDVTLPATLLQSVSSAYARNTTTLPMASPRCDEASFAAVVRFTFSCNTLYGRSLSVWHESIKANLVGPTALMQYRTSHH